MILINARKIAIEKKSTLINILKNNKLIVVYIFASLLITLYYARVDYGLGYTSKISYTLENRLNQLLEENTVLEGVKANTLNMREIQKKALELGFVYNEDVNYVK